MDGFWGTILLLAGMLLFMYCFYGVYGSFNAISPSNAVPRFAEIAQVAPDHIQVVRSSNYHQWGFGNSHEVVFELKIDGKSIGGVCTSNVFSPMVCRLYNVGN
jgi:hypothetical protein